MIIAIDGGTTNTRLSLVKSGHVIDKIKCKVGARDTASPLRDAVKSGISELLARNSLTERDVRLIALSGMIGSESGLCEIPHIVAPAGLEELRLATKRREFPEISPLPFYFIPGVKTFETARAEALASLDIMRGEECELVGIYASLGVKSPLTAVMPGSHMKIVELDESGRIVAFRTSISGELSRAAAENTILKRSLGDAFPRLADVEFLRQGCDLAEAHGIGEALFKVRVRANFVKDATPEQLYAFLLGAILRDDVHSILETGGKVIVAGSEPFRSALCELLAGKADVAPLDEALSEDAAAIGAELITRSFER